ncbi:AfsR/SARP family transcriptional regulator [Streptomyces sp. NPDC054841]
MGASSRMHIQLLGALTLSNGGNRTVLTSTRTGAILALMALSPRTPVPIDQLVEEIWPDQRIANARNALHANIRRIRKLFGELTGFADEQVMTVRGGYLLQVPADTVDAHRFVTLADRGSGLVERDPADAVRLLETALDLWQGPALLELRDSVRLRIEAERLEERRLCAYEDLISAKFLIGAGRGMTSELRQLALEYPERERLVELLMLALYDEGRQTEALDVFHSTRRRLVGDLGVEPGRALHRLYQAILSQDASLGEPRSVRLYSAQLAS